MGQAVVVGSGPNGLAAAVLMARAGFEVDVYEAADTLGGGARTAESTLPGFHHDVCSGAHPMGLASPFFRAFDLAAHGVEMLVPEASYAHPLDGGRAGIAWKDLARTADGLGADGPGWLRLFEPLVRRWGGVVELAMSDKRRLPQDLLTATRMATRAVEQGGPWWNRRFRDEVAPAMFSGVAGHAIRPLPTFAPAGAALLLATLAHAVGWPVPKGGSQAIADALVADLRAHGGRTHTGHRVQSLSEFPTGATILLDIAPAEFLRIAGAELPARYQRVLRRFRYGGAAAKVDFALRGPVPWQAPGCDLAGTLHVVGTRAQAADAEAAVAAGRHAERPYVLAIQPGVVDPSRAPEGAHTFYTYAHVPNGSTVDVGDAVAAQVERFAPGFSDLVLARNVVTAEQLSQHNRNYVGGDISAGAMSLWQTVMRPGPRWNPFATPLPGVFLCSSATPPGPGVHGMCGVHAVRHALRESGIRTDPLTLLT